MPRCVRNFWAELQVDGRQSRVATGPRSALGGFELTIYIREGGEISDKVLHIYGAVVDGGARLNLLARLDGVRGTLDYMELTVDRDAPKAKAQAVTGG